MSPKMPLVRSLASYWRRNLRLLDHQSSHLHDHVHVSHLRSVAAADQRRHYSEDQYAREIGNENIDQKSYPIPTPPQSPFSWARWAFGSMLALVLPFWHKLLRLEGEVEMVADVVENAAEVVEKVATVAERVSSEVADRLPEDGKLRNATLLLEKVAKEAAEEAHLAKDIIHKVDEVKNEVEMLLEPIIETEKHVDEGHGSINQ